MANMPKVGEYVTVFVSGRHENVLNTHFAARPQSTANSKELPS